MSWDDVPVQNKGNILWDRMVTNCRKTYLKELEVMLESIHPITNAEEDAQVSLI
jgi:hypothetical protein